MKYWTEAPTVDELEDFLGADEVTVWHVGSAILVVVASIILAGLIRRLLGWLLRKVPQFPPGIPDLIGRATGWFVILIGFILALTVLGIDMLPALMLFLIVGIVFFVVGKGLLSNFSAGLVIQGTPMFFVGDQISMSAGIGTVTFVTARTVVIETEDGREIHIPNRIVINDPVTNLTHLGVRRSTLEVGVAYGTDLDGAKLLIEAAVDGCETTRYHPPAEALVAKFGESAVEFAVHFWHDPTIMDELRAVDNASRAIATALRERGIVIALPQRVLHWDAAERPDPLDT
jgi:small conductance mechanosensitive channel